ncbi:hypothetical protein FBR04_00185 [Betaproteobacteria bacterium PRO7]|jgi:predicted acyltransferase|nr:hypothetical protein [Betaproteobacteria bacterium PRO7]
MTRPTETPPSVPRIAAVDLYRGLVLLMLLPDPGGFFSLHRYEEQVEPGSLAANFIGQFQHSKWSGVTAWDLIMPAFVFVSGVAMQLSFARRRERGDSLAAIWSHAAIRAGTLICLGLALSSRIVTTFDEIWPLLILLAGLPVPSLLARYGCVHDAVSVRRLELFWWTSLLALSVARFAPRVPTYGIFESAALLVQLGLAMLPAMLVVGRPLRVQCAVAAGLLVAYWIAFVLHPLPVPGLNPAALGVSASDEWFGGFFARWNKNTNFASAFDVWLFNLAPRTEPFTLHGHGYQTLNFVPMAANVIAGVMAGTALSRAEDLQQLRSSFLAAGSACVMGALFAGAWLCPIVKSIWTPTYAIFGIGVSVLSLAAILGRARAGPVATFLVVLGSNSLLLYTLSMYYRWKILDTWQDLTQAVGLQPSFPPVMESALVLLTLWTVAYVLHRWALFIRI